MLDAVIPDGVSRQAAALAEANEYPLDQHTFAEYDRMLRTVLAKHPGIEESVEFRNVAQYLCGQHHQLNKGAKKQRVAITALAVAHARGELVANVEDMADMSHGHLAKLKAGRTQELTPVQVVYLADMLKVPIAVLFEDFDDAPDELRARLAEGDETGSEASPPIVASPARTEVAEVPPAPVQSPPSDLEPETSDVSPPSPAVIPSVASTDTRDSVLGEPLRIKISKVVPDPRNPRKRFDDESVAELADSIQAKGQETPARVTKDPDQPGTFMLVSGERRLRALNLIWDRLGRTPETEPTIDCFIKVIEGGAHERLLHAFMENSHREDMADLDIAATLAELHRGGESIADLARASRYSESYVRNFIAIDGLPAEVKALMEPNLPRSQRLNTTTAIDLTTVRSPTIQIELAREAIERQLGVAETRYLIDQRSGGGRRPIQRSGHERSPSDRYKGLARYLGRTTAWARRFMQDGRDPIDDMFFHRDNEEDDRKEKAREIEYLIARLEELRDIVAERPME